MEYILIALALIIGLIFGFLLKQVFTSKAILSAKKRADNILEETNDSHNKTSIKYMKSVIHNYYDIYEKTITENITPLNTTKIAFRLGMVEQDQVDTMKDFSEGKIDYATMRGICG